MTGSQMQQRNVESVRLLSADLQPRYDSTFAWKTICAARLALPGLRGFWPMSSFDEGGDAYDLSGQGRTLTFNAGGGAPVYNYAGLIPYIDFDANGYLERADEAGLDIIGTETSVAAAARGITIIAWVKYDNAATVLEYIAAKRDSPNAADTAYGLLRNAAGNLRFSISSGAALEEHDSTGTLAANTWYHVAGHWDPSTEIANFINGVETTAASAIAALPNIGASFQVGGRDDGVGGSIYNMDGKVCFVSLHAAFLSATMIQSSYHHERALFGVR